MSNITSSLPACEKPQLWTFVFTLLAVSLCLTFPAFAQSTVSGIMCLVVDEITGPLGRLIACIGVIAIGVNAMIGRTSWTAAIIVAVGIAVVFGAKGVVVLMAGPAAGGFCGLA